MSVTRQFVAAAAPMVAELEAAGLDTGEFGTFTTLYRTTFDYARATPILIEWLPRIDEPSVVEAIARSLTGERGARGEGARQLIAAFRRMSDTYPEHGVAWTIGNALSTIAGPADADDLVELLTDKRHGTGTPDAVRYADQDASSTSSGCLAPCRAVGGRSWTGSAARRTERGRRPGWGAALFEFAGANVRARCSCRRCS